MRKLYQKAPLHFWNFHNLSATYFDYFPGNIFTLFSKYFEFTFKFSVFFLFLFNPEQPLYVCVLTIQKNGAKEETWKELVRSPLSTFE